MSIGHAHLVNLSDRTASLVDTGSSMSMDVGRPPVLFDSAPEKLLGLNLSVEDTNTVRIMSRASPHNAPEQSGVFLL